MSHNKQPQLLHGYKRFIKSFSNYYHTYKKVLKSEFNNLLPNKLRMHQIFRDRLLMPASQNYFYDYLENSYENKDALIYFGLYADIRTFLLLIEDGESDFILKKQAEQNYQDYIGEGQQFDIEIPDEIHLELSRFFEGGGEIEQIDETLFQNYISLPWTYQTCVSKISKNLKDLKNSRMKFLSKRYFIKYQEGIL